MNTDHSSLLARVNISSSVLPDYELEVLVPSEKLRLSKFDTRFSSYVYPDHVLPTDRRRIRTLSKAGMSMRSISRITGFNHRACRLVIRDFEN